MSEQDLKVETQLQIAKSPHEVYEAIVNPELMSCYFTTSGSGRLDAGKPVVWRWDDYNAECTVTPLEIEPDRTIIFLWSGSGMEARVELHLEPTGSGGTNVKVTEAGWPLDAQGTARCLEQMQGWVHMLCCLKAYLEYGINLRS
ncbi:MAG: SRPBCC family protein [bacterium]